MLTPPSSPAGTMAAFALGRSSEFSVETTGCGVPMAPAGNLAALDPETTPKSRQIIEKKALALRIREIPVYLKLRRYYYLNTKRDLAYGRLLELVPTKYRYVYVQVNSFPGSIDMSMNG